MSPEERASDAFDKWNNERPSSYKGSECVTFTVDEFKAIAKHFYIVGYEHAQPKFPSEEEMNEAYGRDIESYGQFKGWQQCYIWLRQYLEGIDES